MIVKPQYLEYAREVFAGTGLQITIEGQRHLGAVIGSAEFRDQYVTDKIQGWVEELKMLEKVAKVEPHVAYCAYVFGMQHKYTYLLRTIPNIAQHLKKLDDAIDNHLIKQLINNHTITDTDRQWFSLPARLGGLGINIPSEIADTYYSNSKLMTRNLVRQIIHQHNPAGIPTQAEKPAIIELRADKTTRENEKVEWLRQHLDPSKLKLYEAITEKGASSWLNAMPLKEHNFYLDKQTFWDSVHLRYGIPLSRLPMKCVCDAKFDVEHALTCKRGGFVTIRHNEVRDFTAELLGETCNDVAIEPMLTPLTGKHSHTKRQTRMITHG